MLHHRWLAWVVLHALFAICIIITRICPCSPHGLSLAPIWAHHALPRLVWTSALAIILLVVLLLLIIQILLMLSIRPIWALRLVSITVYVGLLGEPDRRLSLHVLKLTRQWIHVVTTSTSVPRERCSCIFISSGDRTSTCIVVTVLSYLVVVILIILVFVILVVVCPVILVLAYMLLLVGARLYSLGKTSDVSSAISCSHVVILWQDFLGF